MNPTFHSDILTTVFLNDETAAVLLAGLDDEDFPNPFHAAIFSSCQGAYQRGETIDAAAIFLTLPDAVKKRVPDALKVFTAIIDGPSICCDPEHAINELKAERRQRHICELANDAYKKAERGELAAAEDSARAILAEGRNSEVKKTDPPFPLEIFIGAAGNFADIYADLVEAPPAFSFMAYLTCFGSVVARRVRLRSVLRTQPRLYTSLVGESGSARKSTSIDNAIAFFRSAIEGGFGVTRGVGSAEGLQLSLKENSNHGTGLLLALDELKALVSKCGIDGSVLLPCINTLFESNQYHNATKKKMVAIEDAYLSVLSASTLETYERLYNSAFTDIGFPNRVFLVIGTAERKHAIPKQIDPVDHRDLVDELGAVLKNVGDGIEMDFSPDARAHYETWYMALEQTVHSRRLDTYSLRLAMLLALNDGKREIDLESAQHATILCDWELAIRKIYDPIDADNAMAAMEQRIKRALLKFGCMGERNLKRRVNASRSGVWLFESAAANLRKSGDTEYNAKRREWRLL